MTELNPQREQMAAESMVRTLEGQAQAIWPQEKSLFARYRYATDRLHILDAGCGTGEISSRLARLYPEAEVLGVDILEEPLQLARARHQELAPRLSFSQQSIFELPAADATYDLVVCRHVLQSVPEAGRVLQELRRVTKAGGWLHTIVEDYGMLHFPTGDAGVDAFWREGPSAYGAATHTDMFVGRHAFGHFVKMGIEDIAVDYIVVDPVRVPRAIFAGIIRSWRDGYVEPLSQHTRFSASEARAAFDRMIADILDPNRYAAWLVPVVSGRVPG